MSKNRRERRSGDVLAKGRAGASTQQQGRLWDFAELGGVWHGNGDGSRHQAGKVGESPAAKGSCPVLLTSHGTQVKCWSSDAGRA